MSHSLLHRDCRRCGDHGPAHWPRHREGGSFVRGADEASPSDKGAYFPDSHDVPVQLTGSSKREGQTGQNEAVGASYI